MLITYSASAAKQVCCGNDSQTSLKGHCSWPQTLNPSGEWLQNHNENRFGSIHKNLSIPEGEISIIVFIYANTKCLAVECMIMQTLQLYEDLPG